jgi:CPA1 family monovalent cation:H+ antiporter
MKLWHIAALLLAGIGVGIALPGRFTPFFGDATLYVFLPALIFEAAWSLDLRQVQRNRRAIALLAVPGVALTAGVIAAGVHYGLKMKWDDSLLLGAILSATDPIAVVAIFRRLKVPRGLATIVESESLLNDAMAVVLYRAVLVALIFNASATAAGGAIAHALIGIAIGIGIGAAIAYVSAGVVRVARVALVDRIVTLAGAYGCYALATIYGWSGIFAVIAFATLLREIERRRVGVSAIAAVDRFWAFLAQIANAMLFFLIGAALDFTHMLHTLPIAAVTLGAVIVARLLLAYGLLQLARERLHPYWMRVVSMAGIRGALSLALALATPAVVGARSTIVDATFAVVIVTILAGTMTIAPRLKGLPLEPR